MFRQMSVPLFVALGLFVSLPAQAQYLGNLSANPYDPNSVSNPYGRYGSPYSPDSINNPYGRYGSPYSNQSVNNPYATQAPHIYNHNGAVEIYGDE
jgi:hypothetical protein